jgi:hypothetical protein
MKALSALRAVAVAMSSRHGRAAGPPSAVQAEMASDTAENHGQGAPEPHRTVRA